MTEEFVGYQLYRWWWYSPHSSIFKGPFIEKGKKSGGGGDGEMNSMGPVFYKASYLLQNTTKMSDGDHWCHTLRQNPGEEKNGYFLF